MVKKLLLCLLLACFSSIAFSQIYNQFFDGADTSYNNSLIVEIDPDSQNIWQIGSPHKVIFDAPSTYPNAIVTDTILPYPMNNRSSFQVNVLPWTNWGIFALQWQQKLDMTPDFDGGIVEFSYDNGNTWLNAFNNPYVYNFYGFQTSNQDTLLSGEASFSGTDSTWRDIWLCWDLSFLSGFNDTIKVKFTFVSDSTENLHEGWMIDNMMAHITFIHTLIDSLKLEEISVFPTPAANVLHIDAGKRQAFHIIEELELSNELGQIVGSWKMVPTKFFIDLRNYANGRYNLRVKTNYVEELHTVLIQHD